MCRGVVNVTVLPLIDAISTIWPTGRAAARDPAGGGPPGLGRRVLAPIDVRVVRELVHEHELADAEADRARDLDLGRPLGRIRGEEDGLRFLQPAPSDQDEGVGDAARLAKLRGRRSRSAKDDALLDRDGLR